MERLGIGVIPGAGWTAAEIQEVAQEAEQAGFDAIFSAEANNDAIATAMLMGTATERITVGTWVANVYLRHAYVCAQAAALAADVTGGRFVLGIGVSHRPVNAALGISMIDPLGTLHRYVTDVRGWLSGEGPPTHLPQRASAHPVPIYIGALSSKAVELGGELADGLMPFLWPASRVTRSQTWISRGQVRGEGGPVEMALGLPTFIGDDLASMRDSARNNLALYTTFPFFQRLFRACGFAEEAEAMERQEGPGSLSDRLLDAVCLIGPEERCQAQLARFRAAGVQLPILVPPIGADSARRLIRTLRR